MAMGATTDDATIASLRAAVAQPVSAAKQLVAEIDTQYKLDIADSGWLEYMSKEATWNDCDNVLWELCN